MSAFRPFAWLVIACGVSTGVIVLGQNGASGYKYPFQNPAVPIEDRVTNILSLMTLEEKIACLGTDPDVPRLGIKGSGHIEGLHGVALGGPGHWGGKVSYIPTTQFPQAVGLGETWDPELLEKAAHVEAEEARYTFQTEAFDTTEGTTRRAGIVVRAPNADLARDPRWGRTEESYGEDPFLTGTMAVAFVKGLQGNDPKYWEAAALLKHFLANENENDRTSSSSNFDMRLFHEYYSVPFRMAIEKGGSQAFMTAYNSVNEVPMMVSPILRNVVEEDWGFKGIICTDGGALGTLIRDHKFSTELDEGAAAAIHAGINQFLDRYREPVTSALKKGLTSEQKIDENLRGVFRVMIRLGLIDPTASVRYASIQQQRNAPAPWDTDEHKRVAREITEKSIVLLKNADGLLPLDRNSVRSIAVLGPRADEVDLDWYSGTPPFRITPLAGITKAAGSKIAIHHVPYDADPIDAANAAKKSDVAVVFVGNHPTCNAGWSRCFDPSEGKESIDRKVLGLNPDQEALIKAVYAANSRTIVVLVSSFPYTINWEKEHIPAILHFAHSSEEEGTAVAEALFGDINPAGRLVATWPASIDQLPPLMDYDIRDGHTYMYFKGEPLFPFGFGLSYSTFKYGNLRTSAPELRPGSEVKVQVDVTNTGVRAGDEVAQLYVKHIGSKAPRPAQELKAFRRITLQPGETKTIEMPLDADSLRYWSEGTGSWVLEKDQVEIRVGPSSSETSVRTTVAVGT
jgi:beta-glucosidase